MKEKEFEKYIQQDSWFHGTTLINWKRICASGVRADYNKGLESDFGYGFYLTPRELNAARQCHYEGTKKRMSYQIYRVYNFDVKKKTANVKIYDRFDDRDFRLAPTCWKVHIR